MKRALLLLMGGWGVMMGCGHDQPPEAWRDPVAAPELTIVHVDVGEGDATLIVGPDQSTLLVDGGPTGAGAAVLDVLAEHDISRLDLLILTHPDEDHVGGLDELIRSGVDVGVAYGNGRASTSGHFLEFQAALGGTSAGAIQKLAVGTTLDLGGGATATCVVNDGELLDGRRLPVPAENDQSVGLLVMYGSFRYHVGGDLGGGGLEQADVETPLGEILGALDVLHLHHHGSRSSTSVAFLQVTTPEVAVISVGENQWAHPDAEVGARLQEAGITIFQTGEGTRAVGKVMGTFAIVTDGERFEIDGLTWEAAKVPRRRRMLLRESGQPP